MKLKTITNLMCILSMLFLTVAFAQDTITGKITDDTGGPLFGATVQVQGSSTGVTSDADGNYSIQANEGDVLIFSYLGYASQRITVGSSTTIDVQMQTGNVFDEIIISSSRKPVRKLQSTTAVNSVGAQELATLQPETFTEALQNTPGITIDESQGRKGGFNIRGFPGGNFVTTLIDGMPVSGVQRNSGSTQEFFGIDPNVERIEVVRGAAAALFGRSSAAGAINIISKTGGTEHKGSVSITKYNNTSDDEHKFDGDFDYRADFNINGPLADKLRYNFGGYLLNDSGNKEQANKDKGFQLRTNLDWLISDKSSIRFYGGYFNNEFQNVVDGVWDMQRDQIAEGWSTNNTFYNDPDASGLNQILGVRQAFFNTTPAINVSNGQPFTWNPGESVEVTKGGNVGFDATLHLGNDWYFNGKLKYNSFFLQDINELGLTTIYEASSTIQRLNANALNQYRDILTESRIQKQIDGAKVDHNITAGLYYSDSKRDRLGFNYFYGSNVSTRPTFTPLFGLSSGSFTDPTLPPTVYISNTSSHREESATGLFLGNEMVFNEKLSVNVAWRYDWQTGFISNNPDEIRETDSDFDPGTEADNEIKQQDYSFSIGANYLIGASSAVYANFNRSFTFQTVDQVSDVFLDNELVKNFELGYRAGLGDFTADIAYFNTKIENSIATIFDNDVGGFVQRPAGSYTISGAEIALSYAPKTIKGLLLRGGLTLQKSEYDEFIQSLANGTVTAINDNNNPLNLDLVTQGGSTALNLAGNQVRLQPKSIINLSLGYAAKRWGANFSGFTYSGVYHDAANIYDKQSLSIYNLGGFYAFSLGKDELKLGVRVKNLFNGERAQNLFTGGGLDEVIQAKIADPNYTNQLGFAVLQNPRRTLITLTYQF